MFPDELFKISYGSGKNLHAFILSNTGKFHEILSFNVENSLNFVCNFQNLTEAAAIYLKV